MIPLTLVTAILGQFFGAAQFVCLGVFFIDLIAFSFTIFSSLKTSKKIMDEGLPFYFLELLNRGAITRAQYENRLKEESIIRGYYADYRRTRMRWMLAFVLVFITLLSILLYFFI